MIEKRMYILPEALVTAKQCSPYMLAHRTNGRELYFTIGADSCSIANNCYIGTLFTLFTDKLLTI